MKKKKIILAISALLIIGGAGTLIYKKIQSNKVIDGKGMSGYILADGVEPNLTEEELQALLQKQVDESKVVFSIYSEPTFNGKKGTIMFANPQHSAHDIDLSVEVNGKEIIKTDKISPNQYIEEIELIGRALKKGEHEGKAMITGYKRDTGEKVGQIAVEMNIKSE